MNETEFKTLRELAGSGPVSQRQLSKKVGLSLGAVNYVIKELIKKGYIVAERFKNSNNKKGYIMPLPRKGSMPTSNKHKFSWNKSFRI
jgi:DNA-binding Lrp family transcriptional regulator